MEAFPLAVELVDEGQQLGHQVPLGGKDASGHHLGLRREDAGRANLGPPVDLWLLTLSKITWIAPSG